MDEKSEISRLESQIIRISIVSSWTREVRDLRPRTSDYKFQDRAFMDEKLVLALSGWRSAFLLLHPWGFFIHEGSVIWLNVVIDHYSFNWWFIYFFVAKFYYFVEPFLWRNFWKNMIFQCEMFFIKQILFCKIKTIYFLFF
jgi:hypothetical protein